MNTFDGCFCLEQSSRSLSRNACSVQIDSLNLLQPRNTIQNPVCNLSISQVDLMQIFQTFQCGTNRVVNAGARNIQVTQTGKAAQMPYSIGSDLRSIQLHE